MTGRWYEGATRGQWMALIAALLGWMFDGFEMGIFPLVARPALIDVLEMTEDAQWGASLGRSSGKAVPAAVAAASTLSLLSASSETGAAMAVATLTADRAVQARARVDGQVGLWNGRIVAAFLVGAAIGGWFFGWLGDRLGRVRAMVFSVLTYAVFTGLCGLAQDVYQLAGLRFLAALGMGGEWSLGVALVMESWAPRARPMLAGLIGAAANVGFILTAVPVMIIEGAGVSVDSGGWRWVLGICAFPALLTFFLRIFVPESEKWHEATQSGPRARFTEIFAPAVRWRTIMAATLGAIALIGTWGSVQWIPLWVRSMTGSQQMANNAQICSGIGAVIGTLCGAVIGQYVGRRWTYFALCLGSLLICAYLFRWHFLWHSGVDIEFFVVVLLVGGLTASFYGWLPLYLPELFPTRIRATGQGFGFNFGRMVAAAGALSMGILMNEFFHGSYAQAGATVTLIYLVGMFVVWWAPETHGRPLPD
jgi:SHS family sialic acid transporter-like MFS transporter